MSSPCRAPQRGVGPPQLETFPMTLQRVSLPTRRPRGAGVLDELEVADLRELAGRGSMCQTRLIRAAQRRRVPCWRWASGGDRSHAFLRTPAPSGFPRAGRARRRPRFGGGSGVRTKTARLPGRRTRQCADQKTIRQGVPLRSNPYGTASKGRDSLVVASNSVLPVKERLAAAEPAVRCGPFFGPRLSIVAG